MREERNIAGRSAGSALGFAAWMFFCAPAAAQLKLTAQEIPQSALEAPSSQTVGQSLRRNDGRKAARTSSGAQTTASIGNPPQVADQPAPSGNFPHRLTQGELRQRFFNGTAIISRGRGSTALYTIVFAPNGAIERTDGKGDKVAGRWRFQGDAYCSRWEGEKRDNCYTVVEDGEVIKVVLFTRAIATWSVSGTPPAP